MGKLGREVYPPQSTLVEEGGNPRGGALIYKGLQFCNPFLIGDCYTIVTQKANKQ
jgi:hypothetical protein